MCDPPESTRTRMQDTVQSQGSGGHCVVARNQAAGHPSWEGGEVRPQGNWALIPWPILHQPSELHIQNTGLNIKFLTFKTASNCGAQDPTGALHRSTLAAHPGAAPRPGSRWAASPPGLQLCEAGRLAHRGRDRPVRERVCFHSPAFWQ